MKNYLFLLLSLLIQSGLSAQNNTPGTAPKINDEDFAMETAKTKPKDTKMGLPGPRHTETIENGKVAEAFKTLEKGNVKQAIDQLDDYSDTDPDAAYGLGVAYYKNGQVDKATQTLEHAIEMDKTNSDVLYELGQIYIEQGAYGKAEEMFLLMLEEDPKDGDAWYELGFLYSMDDGLYSDAEYCFKQALSIDPKDPFAPYELSRLHAAKGDVAGALAHLEQSFKNGFNDAALVREDPELDSLRGTEKFQALMEMYFPD